MYVLTKIINATKMKDNEKPSNPRMHNPDGMYASEARNEDYFSLRDYFAAKAMQGELSSQPNNDWANETDLAQRAYLIADAMLKERTK